MKENQKQNEHGSAYDNLSEADPGRIQAPPPFAPEAGKESNDLKRHAPGWKPGFQPHEIKALPKGQRPEPEEYLEPSYIQGHLAEFKPGSAWLVTDMAYSTFIENAEEAGRPDGQFQSPKGAIDEIAGKAEGSVEVIEEELGIPEGDWQEQGGEKDNFSGIFRIDVPSPENFNLRMATGNEEGVNGLWEPGGFTPQGHKEAITDPIPKGEYQVNKIIE